MTDAAGRSLTFAYGDEGLVSSVTDPAGRTVSYACDGAGNLTQRNRRQRRGHHCR